MRGHITLCQNQPRYFNVPEDLALILLELCKKHPRDPGKILGISLNDFQKIFPDVSKNIKI